MLSLAFFDTIFLIKSKKGKVIPVTDREGP
jgi:hypothetical protein